MRFRKELLPVPVSILIAVALSATAGLAQGGWRQWEIHLLDGSVVEANPLGMKAKGLFTRSMNPNETGIERSKIAYLAVSRQELPPFPSETFKHDAVVLLDGSKVTGPIKFREIKFSEGIFLQNGRESSLEKVAYVIFKRSKKN